MLFPAPLRRWSARTFDSLSVPGYRVLWIGSMLAFVAFFMATIAQSVVAFDLTGENSAVGAVVFGQGLAMLFLAPFGGALADRVSKRTLLLVAQAIVAGVFIFVGVMIAAGAISIPILAASSFAVGTMFSLLGPARQAYVGVLVEHERRGNAIALNQVALNTGRVLGPFIAGALLAWPLVDATGTYFLMGAMYLAAVATLTLLPPAPGRGAGEGPSVLEDVLIGVRYVAEQPRLRALIVQFVFVMLAGFPFITVMPAFVEKALDADTGAFGVLMGVMASGGLLASLLVAPIADSPRAPLVLTIEAVVFGIALFLTGIAPSVLVAAGTMFFVGLASGGFQTLNNSVIIRESDETYYGRVMSLTMMAFAGFSIMAYPVGAIADVIGERAMLMSMGASVTAVALAVAQWTLRVFAAPLPGEPEREPAQPALGR